MQLLRDEVVSLYGGANLIVAALPDLGVHLSANRQSAILVVGNIVFAPIVRHFTNVVPSTNTRLRAELGQLNVPPAPPVAALDGAPPPA